MLAWAPIVHAIEQRGLAARGAFALDDDERRGELADVATIALVGLGGRRGWAAFSASPEAEDGAADPLDRWSRQRRRPVGGGTRSARALSVRGPAALAVSALGETGGADACLAARPADRPERRLVARLSRRARLRRAPRGPAAPRRGEPVRDLRRAAVPLRLSGRRLHRRAATMSPPAPRISAVPPDAPAWRAAASPGAPVRSAPNSAHEPRPGGVPHARLPRGAWPSLTPAAWRAIDGGGASGEVSVMSELWPPLLVFFVAVRQRGARLLRQRPAS